MIDSEGAEDDIYSGTAVCEHRPGDDHGTGAVRSRVIPTDNP